MYFTRALLSLGKFGNKPCALGKIHNAIILTVASETGFALNAAATQPYPLTGTSRGCSPYASLATGHVLEYLISDRHI
jgi:hypothetical protein